MNSRIPGTSSRILALVLVLTGAGACEIERISQGVRLRADPHEWIVSGVTDKSDVEDGLMKLPGV